MNTLHTITLSAVLLASSQAYAQNLPPETREYSRRGEISPGAEAPSPAAMVAAIQQGAPEKLKATLEYGERVMCAQCVPLLETNLLASGNGRVRELSAWWLRRQPFAAPAILRKMRTVLREDSDPVRRARAAEALGELMDPHATPDLARAAREDADVRVRATAIRALARLNDSSGAATIAAALSDASLEVRAAALDVVIRVSAFRDYAAIVALLGDNDERLRAQAARLSGEFRIAAAEATLAALLAGDASAHVRKASAWALGRLGGAVGKSALLAQKPRERDALVRSAIEVAEKMPARAP